MRKLKTWMVRIAVLSAVGIGSMVSTPSAAVAGECSLGICGKVYNNASSGSPSIEIVGGADGWCWGDNKPRYAPDPFTCTHSHYYVPVGGQSNSYTPDADAFRVPAGCMVKYDVLGGAGGSALISKIQNNWLRVEDRRGKSTSKWIKLSNDNWVSIVSYSCGSARTPLYQYTWADARGYQDQWCAQDGTSTTTGGGERCAQDGWLWAARNYFFCKIRGAAVTGNGGATNYWWLLTDLDSTMDSTRDGRAFVSAFYLSGGPNDTDNNIAKYQKADGTWEWFPDC